MTDLKATLERLYRLIPLGKKLGLGGITLALVIVLIPQLVILTKKLSEYMNVRLAVMLLQTVARSIIPVAVAVSAGLLVHSHVVIARKHFSGLLAELGAFAIVYGVLAWFFIMTAQDHNDARRLVNSILSRFRKKSATVTETATAGGSAG